MEKKIELEENENVLIEGIFKKKITPIIWIVFTFSMIVLLIITMLSKSGFFMLLVPIIILGIWYFIYSKRKIRLCCTDKRIYCWQKTFLGVELNKEAYLDAITDVKVISPKLTSVSLLIKTSGHTISINGEYGCIVNAEEIKDVVMKQKRQSIKSEEYEVKVVSNDFGSSKDKIQELKDMLDNGLITEEDYNNKKNEILSKM